MDNWIWRRAALSNAFRASKVTIKVANLEAAWCELGGGVWFKRGDSVQDEQWYDRYAVS